MADKIDSHGGEPVTRHWFEPLAAHMEEAYLRYSFTKGTVQEIEFLVDALRLEPGQRILDVGCGPGRHAKELGRRGFEVVGVDISEAFVNLARAGAPATVTFEQMDARHLPFIDEFDVVISLCQGAFGLVGDGPGAIPRDSGDGLHGVIDPDGVVVDGMARSLRSGGSMVVSAFSSYFMVRNLEDQDTFDVERGVNHEVTKVLDAAGASMEAELWTSCFTPRELRLIVAAAGLVPLNVWSVTPGSYGFREPNLDEPEYLVTAMKV